MSKQHEERAVKLEREARLTSITASRFSSGIKSQKQMEDASKLYVSAGDERYQQAIEEPDSIKKKNILEYAHQNYKFAKKLAGFYEKPKIQEKIDNLDALINPFGKSLKKSSKKTFRYPSNRVEAETETWTSDDPSIAARRLRNALKKSGNLEGRSIYAILSVLVLLGAVFFVSFNLTGYAVSGLTPNNSRWIGMCLFVCGLVFAFIYLKQKNRF